MTRRTVMPRMRDTVMPANAGIHVILARGKDVDGRDIGERSGAVLRTAMPGHDENRELEDLLSAPG